MTTEREALEALVAETRRHIDFIVRSGGAPISLLYRLADALEAATKGTTEWGIRHAQGVATERTEVMARDTMASLVKADEHRQSSSRGQVRLLKRFVGDWIEVENPYAVGGVTSEQ